MSFNHYIASTCGKCRKQEYLGEERKHQNLQSEYLAMETELPRERPHLFSLWAMGVLPPRCHCLQMLSSGFLHLLLYACTQEMKPAFFFQIFSCRLGLMWSYFTVCKVWIITQSLAAQVTADLRKRLKKEESDVVHPLLRSGIT